LGKDRKCRFRNNLEGFQPEANEPGANGTQPVMDMEDLLAMGNTRKVCPFYYTRSLVQDAELILVPYNYLFDKDARETTLQDVPWSNAVVIFDEAHNLESFASDSASFDLSSVDISGCISEVQKVIGYQQAMPELVDRISADNLVRLKSLFLGLEEYVLTKIPNDRQVFSGEYMMNIFKEGACITHENHAMFVNEAKKVSDIIMDLRSGSSKGQTKIDLFIGCVKRVFGETTEGRCFAKARAYRVHVSAKVPGNSAKGRTISYWCFAPSLAMQEFSNLNIRSIIVTSGTLSPLPSYTLELGLPFPHTLENPHIISDEQIHVRVIGTGVSGKQLSSSYSRRDDTVYLDELGSTIVNLARIVPDGMLIFFPSYGVMANCIERWGGPANGRRGGNNSNADEKSSFFARRGRQQANSSQCSFPHAPNFYGSSTEQNAWKRMLCQKAIIIEPKSTSELPDAIADFHKYLNLEKSTGCILMGVCRGKISEGIDFAHHMCRAVLITGLPFAPYMDPKVKLKREYLDGIRAGLQVKPSGEGGFGGDAFVGGQSHDRCLSGMEWYTQQAHRAVNQAIGRVIRNKDDYGAVILLDSRFGDPKNRDGLSMWVRTRVLPDETFGIAVSGLAKFYRQAKIKALEREVERSLTLPLIPKAGIVLSYEADDDGDGLRSNKIAIVKHAVVDQFQTEDNKYEAGDAVDRSYISQDQVLATMDFETLKSNRDGSELPNGVDCKPVFARETGLAGVYESKVPLKSASIGVVRDSTWPTLAKTESADSKSGPAKVLSLRRKDEVNARDPKLHAQFFFAAAKTKLEEPDFALLRKLLIAMKKHGDAKDSTAYMNAAGSLVNILAQYDKLGSPTFEWEQSLLYMFFPLLPHSRQNEVQKLALRVQLGHSDFVMMCRHHLRHEEHRSFYASVFSALKLIYCIPMNQSFSRSAFLESCLPVIEYLFRNGMHKKLIKDKDGPKCVVDLYFNLLPFKLRPCVKALLNELHSASSTLRMKQKEKASEGEEGLDVSRFSTAPKPVPCLSGGCSLNPEDLEHQRAMQAVLMLAENANSAKRYRVKAELEKESKQMLAATNSHSSSKTHAAGQAGLTRPVKKPFTPTTSTDNVRDHCPEEQLKSDNSGLKLPGDDRIAQLLRQAEASPFVKGKQKPKVRPNARSSTCRICEQICKEVRQLQPHVLLTMFEHSQCIHSRTCHLAAIWFA
jgi:regulator of telomere elongation helicase 1